MANYNVYFETTEGEFASTVSIAADSTIVAVLPDLLTELQDRGYRLAGGSTDNVKVIWNGQSLRQDVPLQAQGVRAKDSLRIRAAPAVRQARSVSSPASAAKGSDSSLALKALYVVVAFLPVWILEFLALVNGGYPLGIAGAVAGCGIAVGLWYFTETSERGISEFLPFVTVLLALATAVLAAQYASFSDSKAWTALAPALIVGIAGGMRARTVRKSICEIGGESFTGLDYTCPRCGHLSCTLHWSARRVRCTNCDQHDIVWLCLLGLDWWDKRLGPQIAEGECARCHSGPESRNAYPEQRDLRECSHCEMLQCRWCWDLSNGACVDEQHCGWVMEDLPTAIAAMSDRQ